MPTALLKRYLTLKSLVFLEDIHANRSSGPISDAEIIDFPWRYPCQVVFLDLYLTLKSLIFLDDIHAKWLFWTDVWRWNHWFSSRISMPTALLKLYLTPKSSIFIEDIHANRYSEAISDAGIIDFHRGYPCKPLFWTDVWRWNHWFSSMISMPIALLKRYRTLKSLIFIDDIHANRSSEAISDAEIIDFPRGYQCQPLFWTDIWRWNHWFS